MSGQKRLERVCKHNRVIAMPTRKKEVIIKDLNGETMKDKNGEPIVEKIQLYKITKLN